MSTQLYSDTLTFLSINGFQLNCRLQKISILNYLFKISK